MDTTKLSLSKDELHPKFISLTTPRDIADLLEVDLKRLFYHIYIVPDTVRYIQFDIPKKRGGLRTISAPSTALKIIQRKLNEILLHVYEPKISVHSFLLNRSILSNAKVHIKRRNILNIDLEDFFPSVNFGRVRGLFMGIPYKLNPTVATILAQICCFNNQVPQGAPTSPIITNMICAKMDSQLIQLAKVNRCDYTRYVDDITFSTNLRELPSDLATLNDLGQLEIGTELDTIITQNGFKINSQKTRLLKKNVRQEVTGITVNQFPNVRRKYVRQIRAMLHAWEKYGYDAAQEEYYNSYDKKHRSPFKPKPLFKQIVKGKLEFLGMVRGKTDRIYLSLCNQLKGLAPELVKLPIEQAVGIDTTSRIMLHVKTEGKTDWKHMKCAEERLIALGYSFGCAINFEEFEDDRGDKELARMCNTQSKTPNDKPMIFVFDRDNLQDKDIKKVVDPLISYKQCGNNVYSIVIPTPTHRRDTPDISIELYYKDEELQRQDKDGRRLFLSNEFQIWGRHKELPLTCTELNKIKSPDLSIIISKVCDDDGKNIALSKNDFAEHIINQEPGFNDFDFTEFINIFRILSQIAKQAKS